MIYMHESWADIEKSNLIGQLELNKLFTGAYVCSGHACYIANKIEEDPNSNVEFRAWYETMYGPYGLDLPSQVNPIFLHGDIPMKKSIAAKFNKLYPSTMNVTLNGSTRQFDTSTISSFATLRAPLMDAINSNPGKNDLTLKSEELAKLKMDDLIFFE